MSTNCQTAVWYWEKVLAAGPSCWKPVMVKRGRALLKAALVGMPGMPRAAEAVRRVRAGLEVGAAGVADAGVVEQAGGEGVGLVEDDLLAEDVGEAGGSGGAEDGGGRGAGAFGEEGYGLLDFGVVGVAGEGSVALR